MKMNKATFHYNVSLTKTVFFGVTYELRQFIES